MYVKSLHVNVLGVNAELNDLSNIVEITGRNGAGKSRIITALFAALCHNQLPNEKKKQLLESDGQIEVELDNGYKITRIYKDGKSSIHVRSGQLIGSQKVIDSFI